MQAITSPATATTPAVPAVVGEPRRFTGWGARAAIAAPVLAVFSIVTGAPLYADDLSKSAGTDRFVLANATSLGVLLLLTLALVGMYLHGERRLSVVGHAGFLVALLGTVLAAGGAWDSLFTVPYIVDKAPSLLEDPTGGSLLAGFVVSYLVMVFGWVVFASASLRARLLPRAAAIVLIAGAVFAILPSPTAVRLLPLAIGAALAGRAVLRPAR
jgi:hypothetical protein